MAFEKYKYVYENKEKGILGSTERFPTKNDNVIVQKDAVKDAKYIYSKGNIETGNIYKSTERFPTEEDEVVIPLKDLYGKTTEKE